MITARDLARRYIKESGEASSFADRPVSAELIVKVLGLMTGAEQSSIVLPQPFRVRTDAVSGSV